MAAPAQNGIIGLSVEESINLLAGEELRIFYSSDLIRPSMAVTTEPTSSGRIESLEEILAPHGLMLRPGFNESWLIVRRPAQKNANGDSGPPSPREANPRPAIAMARPVEEVVVSASRYEIQGANTGPMHALSDVDLEFSPDIGDDAIRAVARLPGMASNGLSALANIRGGEIRETLVRLDGLRLYDPFHLKDFQGVFSVIDPRVVGSMDIYTGAYPARFGDRMSGVIDVETISPPDDLHHEIGVSFFNTSVLSSGSFLDDQGSWVVSARRSNIDILYDRFSRQPERPRYTDLFAKMGIDVSDRLRITGSLLRARDNIALADDVDREERASAIQADAYAWLNFEHRLGGQIAGTTLFATANIDSERIGTSEKLGVSSGYLSDYRSFSVDTLRSEWTRIIGAKLLLEFGGEVSNFSSRYDYQDQVDFDLLFDVAGAPEETNRSRSVSVRPDARQYSLFTALRLDHSPKLATEFGLRWSEQMLRDGSTGTREPRIGVRYAFTDQTAIRVSVGRFFQIQGVNELQVSDGETRIFPPQQADHFVVGLDRQLPAGTMLRIEVYRKAMSDLRPRFENLLNSRVLLPELKPDRIRIAPLRAEARGLEISLNGKTGAFQWWGSISWAEVEDRVADGFVPRSWDQPFALNAGFLWDSKGWSLSSGMIFRAGWPTSVARLNSTTMIPTATVAIRNTERMKPYGSLDMRLSREFTFDRSELDVFVELTNLSNRTNTCCVEYEVGDEEDMGLLVLDERAYLPTIPSIGFTWKF